MHAWHSHQQHEDTWNAASAPLTMALATPSSRQGQQHTLPEEFCFHILGAGPHPSMWTWHTSTVFLFWNVITCLGIINVALGARKFYHLYCFDVHIFYITYFLTVIGSQIPNLEVTSESFNLISSFMDEELLLCCQISAKLRHRSHGWLCRPFSRASSCAPIRYLLLLTATRLYTKLLITAQPGPWRGRRRRDLCLETGGYFAAFCIFLAHKELESWSWTTSLLR